MDYAEEQNNELEALKAIYADDLKETSQKPIAFEIIVNPYTTPSEDEVNHGKNWSTWTLNFVVSAVLQITYTDKYPEEVPQINVYSKKGLNRNQCEKLKEELDQVAKENVGNVVVFMLAQHLQDWLLEHNDKKQQDEEEKQRELSELQKLMKKKEQEKKELERLSRFSQMEEEEEKKPKGTPVTKENFAQWKIKFDKERLEKEAKEKKPERVYYSDITGRQWFEQKSLKELQQLQKAEEEEEEEMQQTKQKEPEMFDESVFLDE